MVASLELKHNAMIDQVLILAISLLAAGSTVGMRVTMPLGAALGLGFPRVYRALLLAAG